MSDNNKIAWTSLMFDGERLAGILEAKRHDSRSSIKNTVEFLIDEALAARKARQTSQEPKTP